MIHTTKSGQLLQVTIGAVATPLSTLFSAPPP